MLRALFFSFSIFAGTFLACGGFLVAEEFSKISFSRDIRPILSQNCFKCHGPDEARDESGKSVRKAGLRLDVPDNQDWLEVIARITSDDPEEVMPPPETNKTLSKEEQKLLQNWIKQGAQYETHWAFVAPRSSTIPRDSHPIDHLYHSKVTHKADPYTLIRRLHLDLIGIPPSIEVADAFAANPTKEAYHKIIDELLSSPKYGERWARRWLDLARYADTNGYEKDRDRSIWPYRDYVIAAFNSDKPFDKFTIEQIAGDMLPNPTSEQIIATGFHRNTMLNEEGGIDPLEFRYYSMTDRVATTGTVWLGLTTGCAQCHTHKYDPITHHDYFGMMAYLDNTLEPDYEILTPELRRKNQDRQLKRETLEKELSSHWPSPTDGIIFQPQKILSATSEETQLNIEESVVRASGAITDRDTYTLTLKSEKPKITALKLITLPEGLQGPGRTEHGNFVLSEIEVTARPIDNSTPPEKVVLVNPTASIEQENFAISNAIDGKIETGWAIHNPKRPLHQAHSATFLFKKPINHPAGTHFTIKLVQNYGSQHTIAKFQLSLGTSEKNDLTAQQDLEKKYQQWLESIEPDLQDWQILTAAELESNTPYLTPEENGIIFAAGDTSKHDIITLKFPGQDEVIHSLRLEALPDPRLPENGPGMTYYEGRKGDFFLSEFEVHTTKALTFSGSSQSAFAAQYSGNADASTAIDGDIQTGWSLKSEIGQRQVAVFNLAESVAPNTPFEIRMHFGRHFASTLGKFRISASSSPKIKAILHRGTLQDFLMQAPELKTYSDEIRKLMQPLKGTQTLVMAERPQGNTRPTLLRHRGEYTQPKEQVHPRLPEAIFPSNQQPPTNRLEFARWLVSSDNPLVARVIVNRHWASFFGEGIVPTLDDFGMQGQPPSHPALLDHLAVLFMKEGWSLKKLHRLIVTSQAYQQDSKITTNGAIRFKRQRLEAEIIRDSILAASGLLSEQMYGPPVKPPQPEGISEVAYGSPKWQPSDEQNQFRRSIYTYQKRTAPFAMLTTFDAGSGESCLAQRDRSNTPLQALTLLNDPMFVDIAQRYGKRLEKMEGSDQEKIIWAFRRLLTRPPTERETQLLNDFYQKHPSWFALTRALFSLDEVVTKN